MKGLFLVFHGFAPHNGISKKIFDQVRALNRCGVDTVLCSLDITPDGVHRRMAGDTVVQDFGRGVSAKLRKRVCYRRLGDYILENGIGFVYMRSDHNANPFLIRWASRMRREGVRVVMEIPTYPYDSEYRHASAAVKAWLLNDRLFRKALARRLRYMVTFTDRKEVFGAPAICISNGIDFGRIPVKTRLNDTSGRLRLIGVADIHFWHGFDRVIAGLSAYCHHPGCVNVTFDIVGGGTEAELKRLHELTDRFGLQDKVIFHGPKAGAELDELFERADLGIASLARHRCGIDSIKTLKNREYAARGIPFVYSETDEDFDAMPYVLKVPADDRPLDIRALIDFYRRGSFSPEAIRGSVSDRLSWDSQMRKVLERTFEDDTKAKL